MSGRAKVTAEITSYPEVTYEHVWRTDNNEMSLEANLNLPAFEPIKMEASASNVFDFTKTTTHRLLLQLPRYVRLKYDNEMYEGLFCLFVLYYYT